MEYRNHDVMKVLKSRHYSKHVSSMTKEDLNGKAEIAEELAWRDIQIDEAADDNERLRAELAEAKQVADNWYKRWVRASRNVATVFSDGEMGEE